MHFLPVKISTRFTTKYLELGPREAKIRKRKKKRNEVGVFNLVEINDKLIK